MSLYKVAGLGVLSAVGLFVAFTVVAVFVDVGEVHDLPGIRHGHEREMAIEKGLFHIDPPLNTLEIHIPIPNVKEDDPLTTEWLDCLRWERQTKKQIEIAPWEGTDCLIERGLRSDGIIVWRDIE